APGRPQHGDAVSGGGFDVDVVRIAPAGPYGDEREIQDRALDRIALDHDDIRAFFGDAVGQLRGVVDTQRLLLDPRVIDDVGGAPRLGAPCRRTARCPWALFRSAPPPPAVVLLGLRFGFHEVGTVLGVRAQPLRRPPHALLVLLVDEPVDRALEPLPRRLREVVALLEVEPGAVRAERLQPDLARLVVAGVPRDHRVGVPAFGLDVGDELQRRALAAERHLVDHAPEPSVVVLVARPQDVDALHHRRVVGPSVVVLEQRPDARRRVRHVERVTVFAHDAPPVAPDRGRTFPDYRVRFTSLAGRRPCPSTTSATTSTSSASRSTGRRPGTPPTWSISSSCARHGSASTRTRTRGWRSSPASATR